VPAQPIKLVLVEDHLLQLDGLTMLLENSPEFTVVKSFNDPKEFLKEYVKLDFDILLADLHMPEVSGK
jgi:DNA-binding NarL/FixJ family response regulator